MNLTAKSAVANILTVATGLIGAATIFHENAYAMLYTGMFGVTSGAVISALSSFTEDSHAKILRNQIVGSALVMGLSTAVIETHPHQAHLHNDAATTLQLDTALTQKIPANTYAM